MLLAALTALPIPTGPSGDAFYTPPSPLPQAAHGTVVWARQFTGGSALPSAATNYRLLYLTQTALGTPVAVSGTLAVPHGTPPKNGWRAISWAHGTTGNAPQCAPSRTSGPNLEQRMLDGFVARGYAVAQTDYEGNGTPGVHPYFVAASAAHDVTDIVRAARTIDPSIGTAWIAMGHSEGGTAALSTAALGQSWAPELDLIGAVSYAPASHVQFMIHDATVNDEPNGWTALDAMVVQGFATVDSRVVTSQIFDAAGMALMPELVAGCLPDVVRNSGWARAVPRSLFRPQGEDGLQALSEDLIKNDPFNARFSTPTMLVHGSADALITVDGMLLMRDRFCRSGTPVVYREYTGETHGSVLEASANDVDAWIAQRFAGGATRSDC